MVQLIAFDMDGTLIDSRLDLAGAVNYMRGTMGLEPLETERIVTFVGNGIGNLVQRSIADSEVDFEEALRRMKRFYSDHLVDTTRLYPGVATGLRELKAAGIVLAVVSNKPTPACRTILEKLEVADCFEEVIGGDSDYPLKPEPDSLLFLRRKYDFPVENCWMFGDHYTDLEAGRRAGFHRAFARYGFGDARQEAWNFAVDSFPEFVMAVKGY